MNALVIVDLSSLDSYAIGVGMRAAEELAERMKDAILAHRGTVYIIDQKWRPTEWSEPRYKLVRTVELARDITFIRFDDHTQDWNLFLKKFRTELTRAGVKSVELGGVWYHPGHKAGGAVGEAEEALKKSFRVRVEPSIVGSWPGVAAR